MSIVHFENAYASGETSRPRGPRSSPTQLVKASETPLIHRNPSLDLESQAVAYYVHEHLLSSDEVPSILKAFPHDILSIRESKENFPVLDLALSSVALATFARKQHHSPAAIQASKNYQKVLQITRESLTSLNESNIDACLLIIHSMSRYEDTIHNTTPSRLSPRKTFESFSHHDGSLAILKLWKARFGHKLPTSDVIKHTRRGVIRSAVMRNLPLPEWLCNGVSFSEQGLDLEYDVIIVRIIGLRHNIRVLSEQDSASESTSNGLASAIRTLTEEARCIDEALQGWTAHLPSISQHDRRVSPVSNDEPAIGGQPSIRYGYSAPAYTAVWNQYYATRMLLHATLSRILKLGRAEDDSCLSCQEQLKIMGHHLVSNLPLCFERSGFIDGPMLSPSEHISPFFTEKEDLNPYIASLVVWPVTIAASLVEVDAEQKRWFRSQLASLGRMMGIGVLACADSERWLEI